MHTLGCNKCKYSFFLLSPANLFFFHWEIHGSEASFLPRDKNPIDSCILSAWVKTSLYVKLETVSGDCLHQLRKKNWGSHKDTSWENIRSLWSFYPNGHDKQMFETPKPQLQVRHEISLIRLLLSFFLASKISSQKTSEKGGGEFTLTFTRQEHSSSICEIFPICDF